MTLRKGLLSGRSDAASPPAACRPGPPVDGHLPADGQFDDTDITMEELHKIGETIVKVIPGMLHKRIDYAKAKEER